MRRTETKAKWKPTRRPLQDLSNKTNSKSFSKSEISKKKMLQKDNKIRNHDSLDRLLLVQSDLQSLLRQIDELVVEAFNVKETSENGKKEVESFTNFITEMLSSLKPWVPRFKKVISGAASSEESKDEIAPFVNVNLREKVCFDVGSPEETTLDSLVSPSPLVSWRVADCNVERGRQLFLLTPLPMSKALSSKRCDLSKSLFERVGSKSTMELPSFLEIHRDENDDLLEGVDTKTTPVKPSDSNLNCEFVSSPVFSKRDRSMLVLTPCLKLSPPKSCVLLEPISESSQTGPYGVRKSTPFPVGFSNNGFSDSSGSEASEDLILKYPELLGIQKGYKPGIEKKDLDSSPKWLFSPPKSCILLDPLDEKARDNVTIDGKFSVASAINQQTEPSLPKENDVTVVSQQNKMFNRAENTFNSLALVQITPMWKEPESTIPRGKRPGESTLKKELWTRFEAVSTCGLRYNASVIQRTARKGFLDMLDEVSCDDGSPSADASR